MRKMYCVAIVFMLMIINPEADSSDEGDMKYHPDLAPLVQVYRKNDQELNMIYNMIMKIYDSDENSEVGAANKKALKEAQLAWIRYRDLAVKSETMVYYKRSYYYTSISELTEQRIDRMKGMLIDMRGSYLGLGPDDYAAAAKQALEKINEYEAKEKGKKSN